MVFYLKGYMTPAHTGVISSLALYYYLSYLLTPRSLRPENGSLFLWFQTPRPWPITVSPALNPFWWPPVTFSLRDDCDCDSYRPPNTDTHSTWKQPGEGKGTAGLPGALGPSLVPTTCVPLWAVSAQSPGLISSCCPHLPISSSRKHKAILMAAVLAGL